MYRPTWKVDGSNYTVDEAANLSIKHFLTACQPDSGSEQRAEKNKLAFLKLSGHFIHLDDGETTM
jgi:hypothetical protein